MIRFWDSDVNEESYIFQKKHVHTPNDDNMWQELKETFEGLDNKNVLIPIVNVRGEILYFAYEDSQKENKENKGMREFVNSTLNGMEKIKTQILQEFFLTVYPHVRAVRMFNLNEWGYRFYKIMKRCGYYIEMVGEEWQILYPQIVGKEDAVFLPETAFMNIYAEGNGFIWNRNLSEGIIEKDVAVYWWKIMRDIGANFYNWTDQKFIQKCEGRFITVTVPRENEIELRLKGEDTARYDMPGVFEEGSAEEIEYCQSVYGRKITRGEWNRLSRTKKLKEVYIAGHGVKMKCFGSGTGQKLYVVGPCIVDGCTVPEDKETFLYCLYQALKKNGAEYAVVGLVVAEFKDIENYRNILDSLTICEGDMVISIRQNMGTYKCLAGERLDLKEVYEARQEYWFYSVPIHTNYAGNRAIANAVAEYILRHAERMYQNTEGRILQVGKRNLSEVEYKSVEKYIQQLQGRKYLSGAEKVGAIVMNCNPMTKGHLYLIETARKSVDYLYVFVVEEDRSDISFAKRYAMVQAQAKEMDNVLVAPSGKFILSYETLPLYFEKAEKQEAVLDATDDLQIFCQYIAPRLGITERFVGEEPTDKVTLQYNEGMKRILPCYGIRLTEIPRLKSGENYISASAVRKLAGEGDWEAVRQLMPKEAYQIYRKSFVETKQGFPKG